MFAFGHLLGAWLLGKAYEKLSKNFCKETASINSELSSRKGSKRNDRNELSDYAWFFLLFGALLPDIDFLIDWSLGASLHRTFTHSILFLIVTPSILWGSLQLLKNVYGVKKLFQQKMALIFAFATGILSHFILDMVISQGIPLFWPSLWHFSFFNMAFFDPAMPSFLDSSYQSLRGSLKMAIVDMALGTTGVFYLWWKRKIKF